MRPHSPADLRLALRPIRRQLPDMHPLGKSLVLAGAALMVAGGLIWWLGPRLGSGGGLLPGDISIRRGNVSFQFPIVTCLVLSALLTLLFRLFQR